MAAILQRNPFQAAVSVHSHFP